jgi:hypothetical protein
VSQGEVSSPRGLHAPRDLRWRTAFAIAAIGLALIAAVIPSSGLSTRPHRHRPSTPAAYVLPTSVRVVPPEYDTSDLGETPFEGAADPSARSADQLWDVMATLAKNCRDLAEAIEDTLEHERVRPRRDEPTDGDPDDDVWNEMAALVEHCRAVADTLEETVGDQRVLSQARA